MGKVSDPRPLMREDKTDEQAAPGPRTPDKFAVSCVSGPTTPSKYSAEASINTPSRDCASCGAKEGLLFLPGHPEWVPHEHRISVHKSCARCKAVCYCSKRCQVAHWKLGHKENCEPTEAYLQSLREKCSATNEEAKAKFEAAKETARALVVACQNCGATDVKLKRCGACNKAWWCSRACQKQAWPAHKAECGGLQQLQQSVEDPAQIPLDFDFPTMIIALPPALTGYQEECPVHVPVWLWERKCTQKSDEELRTPESVVLREGLETAIRYFFKRERQPGSRLSQEDIGHLMCDAMLAFQMKVQGVREASIEFMQASPREQAKWGPGFSASCKVPHDWMLNPAKLAGVPPEIVERWQTGIARVRADLGDELDEKAAQAVLDAQMAQLQKDKEHEQYLQEAAAASALSNGGRSVASEQKLPAGGDGMFDLSTLEHVPPEEREGVLREGLEWIFETMADIGDGFSRKEQKKIMDAALRQMRDRFG